LFATTPLQKISFKNQIFYIKRDDLIDKDFSGNKARKFFYFLNQDLSKYNQIISYGSNQSNAMYSLSVLAKIKKLKFIYYTNHLPRTLLNNPIGNLKYALKNGMILKLGKVDESLIDKKTLFIKEGGAIDEAKHGIKILANELKAQIKKYKLKNPILFLPSGTGTTALFLQKYLDFEVFTTPCVGDREYLIEQFSKLQLNKSFFPKILTINKKFHFGKLYKENFLIWKELLNETKIEFDLLYDPIGWQVLLAHSKKFKDNDIIYLHQGGIMGNESMIKRYEYKFNLTNL